MESKGFITFPNIPVISPSTKDHVFKLDQDYVPFKYQINLINQILQAVS